MADNHIMLQLLHVMVLLFSASLAQRVDKFTCERRPTHTTARRTPGDNGFSIKVVDSNYAQVEFYKPNHEYTVVLNGTYSNQQFLDFMLVAVRKDASSEANTVGHWTHMLKHMTTQDANCAHIMTSMTFHPSYKKSSATFTWTAPPAGTGCIFFRATVVEHPDIWFKDEGGLSRMFCEEPADTANQEEVQTSSADSGSDKSCCACEVAKYELTFKGVWSRESHPLHFPGKSYESLLHWSDLIGASHSKDFKIWQEGQLASQGVKEVCEYGWPRSLEGELRQKGRLVRTVVKANGIWGYPAIYTEEKSVRFSADNVRHHLSMLSMIGPSPDWCVGLDSLDLCLPNCTWIEQVTVPLYPWDAGTDSGISYLSSNQPTFPRGKISYLTNTSSSNHASPFFGLSTVPPFATVSIKRLGKRNGQRSNEQSVGGKCYRDKNSSTQADEALDEFDSDDVTSVTDVKCMVSEWSDFSPCSATCGVGLKSRTRMFKHPFGSAKMCPDVKIEEFTNCLGLINSCDSAAEEVIDECVTSPWSLWSPCSTTCGEGEKVRTRQYLTLTHMKIPCTQHLRQAERCYLSDCTDDSSTDWAAICKLPKVIGRCRGEFSRFYYDTIMGKCLPFVYGGCRGNDNRFETMEECEQRCSMMRKKDLAGVSDSDIHEQVDCVVSSWSEYTSCSVSCGPGTRSRKRSIQVYPKGLNAKPCPKKLFELQVCTRSCDDTIDSVDSSLGAAMPLCTMGEWNAWSEPCSVTCGEGIQFRMRSPAHDEQPCKVGPVKEMRTCYMPTCSHQIPSSGNCMLSEWGAWSECSLCDGEETRYHFRMVKAGICEPEPELFDSEICHPHLCQGSLDCQISDWSAWTACSRTCGLGEQSRFRVITVPVSEGGSCELQTPKEMERRACLHDVDCEENIQFPLCQFTDWTDWSTCSKTCGRGKQVRRRHRNGSSLLSCGPVKQVKHCYNTVRCPRKRGRKRV